jgi:tetratricopeptide (TPR) repeat protein
MGLAYVPDPSNPFATISEEARAVDTIHYPRETLASGVGDCDDTTVLLAALLENVGISTRFVDVPGHIFLMFDSGVHERNRAGLPVDESMYVVDGETIWIPIETTLVGKGFTAAWTTGAENYASWRDRQVVATVDVASSWARFLPAEPPGAPAMAFLDKLGGFEAAFAAETSAMESRRSEFLAGRFGGAIGGGVSPEAASTVAELLYQGGRLEPARAQLTAALASSPASAQLLNNLGVVAAAQGDLAAGIDYLNRALDTEGRDPGIWLNLGLLRYVAGDSGSALDPVVQGLELSGGFAEAARLLRVPDDGRGRAANRRLTAEEVRRLLREAVRRVPAAASAPGDSLAPAAATPHPEPQGVRVAAARAGQDALREYLYWKP